jgi:Ca-activated chloride channel homolog
MSRSLNSLFITLALTACSTTPNGGINADLVEIEHVPTVVTNDDSHNPDAAEGALDIRTSEVQTLEFQGLTTASSTSSYGEDHAQPAPTESILQHIGAPNIGPTMEDSVDFAPEAEIRVSNEAAEGGLAIAFEGQRAPALPQSVGAVGSGTSSRSPIGRMRRSSVAQGHVGYAGGVPTTPPVITNTEGYTNYGVNDMTSTEQDRFSTFSIDVDTGSYTIARRKLNEGMLPPAAAVRVEEFINYFPYEYDAPSGPAPFAVHMEATPNPFQDGHHILRVGVQAQEVDLSDRKPVHLTFLVDVSGSMSSPDKLGLAQRSLRFLVDQLQEGDTVALATYAGRVSAVLEPTDVSDRGAIHSAIMGLQSGGSTAMNSGIQLAYRMAQSAYVPNSENRVIVLSDGDANVGPSSHAAILNTIREYANNGITLSTIGFGMGNYQDTMMEQLANQGDGNYSYIDTYDEAKRIFGENLAGTLNVVARDVKLQVEFNPTAVSSYRLIGYENRDIADRDFRNDAVDAGEIGAGHTVTALYDLVLTDNSPEELATVRVRNKVPGPDAPAVEWLTTMPFDEITSSFTRATPSMRIAFSAATFAELLRGSPYAAEVSWEELIGLTSQAQRPGIAADDELLSLQQQAARLSGTRGTTASK